MHSYTNALFKIHASTVNNDPDNVIRLATDLRFCDSSKPYDKVSLIEYILQACADMETSLPFIYVAEMDEPLYL